MRSDRRQLLATFVALLLLPGLGSPTAQSQGSFQTSPTTFSGQATVVEGKVLGVPITLVDTGPVAAEGGTLEAHLLCFPDGNNCTIVVPDPVGTPLRASVLNATVVAQGNHSDARASVAELELTDVAGQDISATFIEARAHAQCADGQAFVRGDTAIAELVVNGDRIEVTGEVNQKVPPSPLPGAGFIVINEQVAKVDGGNGDLTVSALHIVIPGTGTDVTIAKAHADIQCGQRFCPQDKDFVTGGGRLGDPTSNFAVAGGVKHGAFWGHLLYVDHQNRVKAKGTSVTAYRITGPTTREIEGTCEINGREGTYRVDIDDQGEPGIGRDTIVLTLNNIEVAAGTLNGGNIQLHTCK